MIPKFHLSKWAADLPALVDVPAPKDKLGKRVGAHLEMHQVLRARYYVGKQNNTELGCGTKRACSASPLSCSYDYGSVEYRGGSKAGPRIWCAH